MVDCLSARSIWDLGNEADRMDFGFGLGLVTGRMSRERGKGGVSGLVWEECVCTNWVLCSRPGELEASGTINRL